MAQTYFGSTLRAGSDATSDTVDGGFVALTQRVSVTTVSSAAATGTIKLPANSQIMRLTIDATTAPSGGTATTLNATIGTAAAGTQYLSATNVISATRTAGTFTVAQLGAMKDIGTSNTTVYFTLTPNGTFSTQGVYLLTLEYAPQV
jgi:thiamine biosynthesis protein ThiC